MHRGEEWRRQVTAERDRYIVLLHVFTCGDPPFVEFWTAEQIVRDLGLSRDQAESVLGTLVGAGFLSRSGAADGVAITQKGRDYLQRGAGRRRSIRIPPSLIRGSARMRAPLAADGVPRERDRNREARERLQYRILRWLHDQVGTDCRQIVSAIGLAHDLGTPPKEVYAAIEYLARHGLIGYHGAGPRICLTRVGLEHLERAQRRRSIRIGKG